MAQVAAGEGLSATERHELDRAIRMAEQASRFEFSVFLGAAQEEPRAFAEQLHQRMVVPARSVLILVDRKARVLEVVTGTDVRRHLSDREVELAVLQMQSAFAADDVVGGLKRGIAMLAEHSRPQNTLHAG
ncbi:conserved hypothetical protein [metagenome]|uniref:DUF5130 domain-containing protein n=1 Tax=metagenome TaxID=256318 RepID=A0A2P2C8B9_9ZZZZ